MDSGEFEARLRELEAMISQDETAGLFNQEYERLLLEVKSMPGPRFEKFQRMQRLVYKQTEWLLNEWIREKAMEKMGGQGQEAATGVIN